MFGNRLDGDAASTAEQPRSGRRRELAADREDARAVGMPVFGRQRRVGPVRRREAAAQYLGIATSYLAELDRKGLGPVRVQLGATRAVGYLESDLDDWLAARRVEVGS